MEAKNWWLRFDWLLLGSAAGLVLIGLGSLGVATAAPGPAAPVARQMAATAVGLMAMLLCLWPSYERLRPAAYWLFALSCALLAATYWFEPVNGARRWVWCGPLSFQPSELAKVACVLAVARWLAGRDRGQTTWWGLAGGAGCLTGLPLILIVCQPDLGSALLLLPVLAALLFAAGCPKRLLAGSMAVLLAAAPLLWQRMTTAQKSRISGFLHQHDLGPVPRGAGYQLYQSKRMLALGGLWGSDQASEVHVPYAYADFIFSVVGGRWGLAGSSLTLVLLWMLVWRGLRIAARCDQAFGRLLAAGLTVMLGVQGLLHMAMAIGLAPIAGLTLPFVSYGGSSLVCSFMALGLVLNVGLRS